MRDQADLWAGMFEEAKIDRLLMWLDAPTYRVVCFDTQPADQVVLYMT